MGPVENVRTLNLIQWAMQFMGVAAVFCSSSHQAASLSIVLGKTIFKIKIFIESQTQKFQKCTYKWTIFINIWPYCSKKFSYNCRYIFIFYFNPRRNIPKYSTPFLLFKFDCPFNLIKAG